MIGLDDLTARGGNWGCNVSLGLAGALWSTAFGMVTAGAWDLLWRLVGVCYKLGYVAPV